LPIPWAADYPEPLEVELQLGVAVVVKLLSSVRLDDNLDGIDELALGRVINQQFQIQMV
jgi:hypothetical protein